MKTLKTVKCLVNLTTLFAVFSYLLLIGALIYNFILAILNKIYADAVLTIVFAVLLCVIAHVFVDTVDKVYTKEVKALKDKQTK